LVDRGIDVTDDDPTFGFLLTGAPPQKKASKSSSSAKP
jgi:hypothetical protein